MIAMEQVHFVDAPAFATDHGNRPDFGSADVLVEDLVVRAHYAHWGAVVGIVIVIVA